MVMTVPTGFCNARYIYSVAGIIDQMGFSLGHQTPLGKTATEQAEELASLAVVANLGGGAAWNDEYVFVGVTVTMMTGTGPIVGEAVVNEEGTQTADAPPANCSLLVQKITGLGGRRNRGRFYVPVGILGETSINAAGYIDVGAHASLVSTFVAWYDDLVAAGYEPVLFHDSSGPTTPTPIDTFSAQRQIATQRRRMR